MHNFVKKELRLRKLSLVVGIVRLRKSGINNPARFKYNIENRTLSKINYI